MSRINIVLADIDEMYLNKFAGYLNEQNPTVSVSTFSQKSSFERYLMSPSERIDAVVMSPEFIDSTVRNAPVPAKLIFSDGSIADDPDYPRVDKYQRFGKLMNDILMICAEKTGHAEIVSKGDKDTKLIAFYSPVGGAGKTTLSLAAAESLAGLGKRVFHFGAESFLSDAPASHGAKSTLSDLFLALKSQGSNIELSILSARVTDEVTGVSRFAPADSSLEINDVTAEEFMRLFDGYEKLGEFDYCIVDLDSGMNERTLSILSRMDRIIMPITADPISLAKLNCLESEAKKYDELGQVFERTEPVLNKVMRQNTGVKGHQIKAEVLYSPLLSSPDNIRYAKHAIDDIIKPVVSLITGG